MVSSADSSRLRLDHIKLIGFKSFVEPTSIQLPSNLIGVVGPNGCGKSNIIDAVRWVMGESSAKYLRGESMADVIFNGSGERQPLGQAAIELTFNNPKGAIAGEWAHFEKITIRREVTRDGQSNYFLNNTRCRRRDITDIFLGTGLGPRSYAIIGQGTISRLIEAKPEELRVYLEEAAGISKYKERRRETENRISHTRENLDRLADIRGELQKQLDHLQRQAQTAERYQVLKTEERQLEQELLALRWQYQSTQSRQIASQLQQSSVMLEAKLSELTQCDAKLEVLRDTQQTHADDVQALQERYYLTGQTVSQLEQSVKHQEERIQQCKQNLSATEDALKDGHADRHNSWMAIQACQQEEQALIPNVTIALQQQVEAQQAFTDTEHALNIWQQEWDDFNRDAYQTQQQAQVKQTEIQHLEQQLQSRQHKLLRCQESMARIDLMPLSQELSTHQAMQSEIQEELSILGIKKQAAQETLQRIRAILQTERHDLQQCQQTFQQESGRLASLEALQQSALGHEQDDLQSWLVEQGLEKQPRLGNLLDVDPAWEFAVEVVLGDRLQAVCIDGQQFFDHALPMLPDLDVILWELKADGISPQAGRLASVVRGDPQLIAWLNTIFMVDDLPAALAKRSTLEPYETIITQSGIWVGRNWIRLQSKEKVTNGIFAREKAIQFSQSLCTELSVTSDALKVRIDENSQALADAESELEILQQNWQAANHALADVSAQRQVKQNRLQQLQQHQAQLTGELEEYQEELETLHGQLLTARSEWQVALSAMQVFADQREQLQFSKGLVQTAYQDAKQAYQAINQKVQELRLQHQRVSHELEAKQELLSRSDAQLSQLKRKADELQQQYESLLEPLDDWRLSLEAALDQRLQAEEDLRAARQQLQEVDYHIRQLETARQQHDKDVQQRKDENNQLSMEKQAFDVRQATIEEQIKAYDISLEALMANLSEDANEAEWQGKLERVKQRVQRLGAINLAAIEEYNTQNERKVYLDAQYDDLMQALTTLEDAIRKIDLETRQRFKATYDSVNREFKALFPKVFGGGSAYLEFTGEDLLDTGIAVMARPPGKKNTTIHLLSGGEKALTAIALVFAIFKLNPAPFCMLDEVDAPLDDQNVVRYCQLVKEMSNDVQFIFISHNKIAMGMADQLIGVTMREPGVSRMVSVDIQEAIDMVEK